MKKVVVVSSVVAAAVFGPLTAGAALSNVTTTSLPDADTGVTSSAPISEAPSNQGNALFPWLLAQSISGDPTPVDTIITTGPSTSLPDISADVGDYLVVHWGPGQANNVDFDSNAGGGFEQAFLIQSGGLTSITLGEPSFTLNAVNTPAGAISGWTIFAGRAAPTPEPSTLFAGALLLLPFGASVLRSYRKRNKA